MADELTMNQLNASLGHAKKMVAIADAIGNLIASIRGNQQSLLEYRKTLKNWGSKSHAMPRKWWEDGVVTLEREIAADRRELQIKKAELQKLLNSLI